MRLLGVVLATLVLAAPARAQEPITVRSGSTRVVVQPAPFQLRFLDGRREVLSELPRAEDSLQVAPAPDAPALYGPLTFLVGTQRSVQFPVYQWEGDFLTGVEGGTAYAARDVLAATRAGAGVRLELSTTDPGGRRLLVTIAPERRGALRVSVRAQPADGVATMTDSFASAADESFYGFGGRHNALDQRGNQLYNWLQQESLGAGALQPAAGQIPGGGGDAYLFPTGKDAAYYVQSSLLSDRGYGFLLDRPELSRWRMASERADAWQVAAAAPGLDYVVAPGAPARALRTLTAITGRHRVPPYWALGPQFDRLVRYPSESPQQYLAEVRADIANIDRYKLPVSAYRIEAWRFLDDATLEDLIAQLHARGIRALVYFRAFVGKDEIGTDRPADYDEAVAKGYVARTAGGDPFLFVSNFNSLGAQIDFTNPGAVRWWQARIRAALDLGVDGFMEDFGEQVLVDMHFADGETGATMHNRLPNLMHRATRAVVDEFERAHPGRRIFFFTRAGYTGMPGAAADESGNFPGDETTDFSRSSGLQSLTTDMLNRAVGGLYGFGADIGGYFDVGPYQATTKELFLRWAQWSVFTPFFRLHGSVGAGTHAPWTYDDETVRIYRDLSLLHLRARPLLRRLWRTAMRTGMPPTRPLWLAYPRQDEAPEQDQEWLLGPDVLVAPVVTEGATARAVWIPPGCWRRGRARVRGPQTFAVDATLAQLPYFIRCGRNPLSRSGQLLARQQLRSRLQTARHARAAAAAGTARRARRARRRAA